MANIEDKDSKNNGRWTKIEHEKFLLGKISPHPRPRALWQELEENLIIDRQQIRGANTVPRPEILLKVQDPRRHTRP